MTLAYYVLAGLLAVFYLYSGGIKIVRPIDQLRPMMAWVDTLPRALVRGIGVLEVLAAVGLVVPPLTGIATGLAFAAALGLVVLQVAAASLHLSRGEVKVIWLNLVLLVLAGITAWLATVWL